MTVSSVSDCTNRRANEEMKLPLSSSLKKEEIRKFHKHAFSILSKITQLHAIYLLKPVISKQSRR